MKTNNGNVQVFRSAHAEVFHVGWLQEAFWRAGTWVHGCLEKRFKFDKLRHFGVLNDTLSLIGAKITRITVKSERVRTVN